MKIQILKKKKEWYWRIVGRNGKIIAHSETYSSLSKAAKTVDSFLKQNAIQVEVLD